MRRSKKAEAEAVGDVQVLHDFETLFEKDKREAEERIAIIRARIRTLERAVATKEGKWTASS